MTVGVGDCVFVTDDVNVLDCDCVATWVYVDPGDEAWLGETACDGVWLDVINWV